MASVRFGIAPPLVRAEHRGLYIAHDFCPECGGELDTGWECNDCGFDAKPEADDIDLDEYHRYGKERTA